MRATRTERSYLTTEAERVLNGILPYWENLYFLYNYRHNQRLSAFTSPTCSSSNCVKCFPSPTVSLDVPSSANSTNLLEMQATCGIQAVAQMALYKLRTSTVEKGCPSTDVACWWWLSSVELTLLFKRPFGPIEYSVTLIQPNLKALLFNSHQH